MGMVLAWCWPGAGYLGLSRGAGHVVLVTWCWSHGAGHLGLSHGAGHLGLSRGAGHVGLSHGAGHLGLSHGAGHV
eukprot:6822551-Prymnesium_polylepis.1